MENINDQAQPETTDEHEGQFYCGRCGWVDISDYASHGHEG
jgi:hypothetical protein